MQRQNVNTVRTLSPFTAHFLTVWQRLWRTAGQSPGRILQRTVGWPINGVIWIGLSSLGGLTACNSAVETNRLPAASSPSNFTAEPSTTFSSSKKVTALKALEQQPQLGEAVTLEGNIQRVVPILDGWLYELQDQTSSLWVLTKQSAPVLNSRVRVLGKLQQEQIQVGETDLSEYYLEEQTRQTIAQPE